MAQLQQQQNTVAPHRCHVSVRSDTHPNSCSYVESKMHIEYSRRNAEEESPLGQTDFFLYVMDVSYFSGKMEMYCRYRQLNFKRVEPTFKELKEIGTMIGVMQVPLLYDNRPGTPEAHRWLRDTTPMILYLEATLPPVVTLPTAVYPSIGCTVPPVIPLDDALQFMSFLLEDFADEAMWRPAMYFRWEPEYDRLASSLRFTYEFAREIPERLPLFMRPWAIASRQWLFSCYSEGIHSDGHKQEILDEYLGILGILEGVLEENPFLGGTSPTIVDFGFSGSMFRHFASDTTPRKLMQQHAPGVFEWVGRLWNAKQSKLAIKLAAVAVANGNGNCEGMQGQQQQHGRGDANIRTRNIKVNTAASMDDTATDTDTAATAAVTATGLAAAWIPLFTHGYIRNYMVYLHANAEAYAAGETTFTWTKILPPSSSRRSSSSKSSKGTQQHDRNVSTDTATATCNNDPAVSCTDATSTDTGGDSNTNVNSNSINYTVSVVPYRVWCYRQLQLRLDRLRQKDLEEQNQEQGNNTNNNNGGYARVRSLLELFDCYSPYFNHNGEDTMAICEPEGGQEPPFCNVDPSSGHQNIISSKWNEQLIYRSYVRTVLVPVILKGLFALGMAALGAYSVFTNSDGVGLVEDL